MIYYFGCPSQERKEREREKEKGRMDGRTDGRTGLDRTGHCVRTNMAKRATD